MPGKELARPEFTELMQSLEIIAIKSTYRHREYAGIHRAK